MDYLSGWCKSERRLEGFTIIVTGSNTGMGREIAADLYRRGARVIMSCRNTVTAKEAKEHIEQTTRGQQGTGELVVEELDLCSVESVRAFCARVTSRAWRLRGVVCNAGVMMCPEGRSQDGFETHLASNHLGHALLTLLLLPLLIQSSPSRIVFVSSRIHEFYKLDLDDINFTKTQYTPLKAYANSKIAEILFAKALDLKLKVLCALSFLATGSYQKIVGVGQHLTQRTTSRCIREVVNALNHNWMVSRWIVFPQTPHERSLIKEKFQRTHNLPGVIGCIDCTHIAIARPVEEEHTFFNRKGYHSLNVQMEHNIQDVSTYSLHPGIVKTSIGRHFPQSAWRIVTYGFRNFLLSWCWKTPRCGAQTSIYCAVDEKCENESGFYYSDCAKSTPSRQCQSESEAEKLWNVTIELLNLQDYDPFGQDSSKELKN